MNTFFNGLIYLLIIRIITWVKAFIVPNVIYDLYDCMTHALLLCATAWFIFKIIKKLLFGKYILPINKSVLITGCDTGFGHDLVKKLDANGFQVFAGCLLPDGDGANDLRKTCSSFVHVLKLDVTKDDSVKSALTYVQDNLKYSKLWAVVNNAGVMRTLYAELASMQDFQFQMDVNTLGVVRVTKAFLPLIRKSKGRIVTVTSLAGRLAAPFFAGYCMSKFAATAFCESIRQELHDMGVKVIAVEPEFFKTHLTDADEILSYSRHFLKNIDSEVKADYDLAKFEVHVKRVLENSSMKRYKVINCLKEAVCREDPDNVYKPSRNALCGLIYTIAELLPKPILDTILRFYFVLAEFLLPYLPK